MLDQIINGINGVDNDRVLICIELLLKIVSETDKSLQMKERLKKTDLIGILEHY